MYKIGITGGIGSGKSTVCRLLAEYGAAVYDSDVERLASFSDEMLLVIEENQSHDPPHVVDEIRIEELHGPSFPLRREASQHQDMRPFGKKRLQRMAFYWDYRCLHGCKDRKSL